MAESNSNPFRDPSAFKAVLSPAELTLHNLVPDSGNDPLAYRLSSDCSTSELIRYNLVLPSRIELLSEVLQTPAMTTSAKAAWGV